MTDMTDIAELPDDEHAEAQPEVVESPAPDATAVPPAADVVTEDELLGAGDDAEDEDEYVPVESPYDRPGS